jgi:hypothetical protein
MTQPYPPAGWYPDPAGRHESRYFNGQWTQYVVTQGMNYIDPLAAGPASAATMPGRMPPMVSTPVQPPRLSMTATTWLVALGALGVCISVFLTWETATVHLGLGVGATDSFHLSGVGRFVGVAAALGVVALSAPAFTGRTVSRGRVIGLMVVLAILTVVAVAWTANVGKTVRHESNQSPDIGVLLCWTALVLLWIGAVLLATRRRNPAQPPYAMR